MNNPLNNLAPFYIGQKVVYITGKVMPKNTVCEVKGLFQHNCGHWSVDVGVCFSSKKSVYCCKDDNSNCAPSSLIQWFDSNAFRPLQEQSFPLITYSKVLKEVPVSAN